MAKAKTRMKHPVLCVLFAGVMLICLYIAVQGSKIMKSLNSDIKNFNELTPETAAEGQIVDGLIYGSVGTYGSVYKTDKDGNILEDEPYDFYYLVPVSDNYCITVYTDNTDIITHLDMLTIATDRFSTGETDSIEYENMQYGGRLQALSQDELLHMYQWILDIGLFDATNLEEAAPYIIPYKIVDYDRNAGLAQVIGGCAGFAVSAVLMLIFLKMRVSVDEDDD